MFEAKVRGTVPIEDSSRELEVKTGQVVKVTEIDDSGWAYCKSGSEEGWVPCSCIEPLGYKKTPAPSKTVLRPRRVAPKPKAANAGSNTKEVFPFGTKFNPNTGEKIPRFDPDTGRKNW
mmetsp:Transcript_29180/g.40588  ORF Transcript_29180/g.40588 Transcript_29180/m.40588 type:complete len:119 (+) Transcript_29180:164-520(+)